MITPPSRSSSQPPAYDGFSPRYVQLKKDLVAGNEDAIIRSWNELLSELSRTAKVILFFAFSRFPAHSSPLLQEIEKIGPNVRVVQIPILRSTDVHYTI